MDGEEKKTEAEILETEDVVRIMIPLCCKEGWDTCPHTVKYPKKRKPNIGI